MFHVRKSTDHGEIRVGLFYGSQLLATLYANVRSDGEYVHITVDDGWGDNAARWSDLLEEGAA